MARQRRRRRGFTLVEVLLASAIGLSLLGAFWSCFGHSTQVTARMMETMKVMDSATVQSYMDEDLRTATEILMPTEKSYDKTLIFCNREYRTIEYNLTKGKNGYDLRRIDGELGKSTILARDIDEGFFFRSGPNLVGYRIRFKAKRKPNGKKSAGAIQVAMSSRVYLSNVLF